jgi:hypothetical protein
MRNIFTSCRELELLQTLPGVGFILATVIFFEIGDINRFPTAPQLAAHAGKFIKDFQIDEIPQLINVLGGHESNRTKTRK